MNNLAGIFQSLATAVATALLLAEHRATPQIRVNRVVIEIRQTLISLTDKVNHSDHRQVGDQERLYSELFWFVCHRTKIAGQR
jgi:hypothetical protein